jgi:hypothetical protein
MSITSYLNQTATRYPQSTVDRFGKISVGTGVAFKCRSQGTKSKVINADGQEVTADLEMWVGPLQTVNSGDKIDFESKTYIVSKIMDKRNLQGRTNHKKLLLLENKE